MTHIIITTEDNTIPGPDPGTGPTIRIGFYASQFLNNGLRMLRLNV